VSRAFVKEGDGAEELPERPVSERPNYCTPAGYEALRRAHDELVSRREDLIRRRVENAPEIRRVERELRYYQARLSSAIVVPRPEGGGAEIRFGATIELEEAGARTRCAIVGEDEADFSAGKLSWCSPLAAALIGKKAGDELSWDSGEGERRARVISVAY